MTAARPSNHIGATLVFAAMAFAAFAAYGDQSSDPTERVVVATAIEAVPRSGFEQSKAQIEADAVMALMGRKEFDKALALASTMTRTGPDDPVGYNLQGAAYLGKKDNANARRSFETALRVHPDDVPALMNLAQLDLQEKDVASARKRYQAVLARDERSVPAMVGMAKLEAATDNDKESLAWLEKAKAANPEALAPRLYLSTHHLRTKDYQKALAELTEARRTHPDNPDVLDLLGRAQAAAGHKTNAVSTYRKLVSVRPDSPVAYYRLAVAQIGDEDFRGAAESLRKAIQLKPDYVEAINVLVGLELRAGGPAEALKLARDLQKRTPKSPAGFALEGDVHMAQQRFPDALNAYEKAFSVRQSSLLAVKLHAAGTKAGKTEEADARFQQWLTGHPDDLRAWEYWAGKNQRAGRSKLAIEQYERVLKKDPDNVLALSGLARLYQQQKDPRALETAERAYKLKADSPTTADTLGWILVEQGQTARGLELVRKAVAQDRESAEIRYHLAVALAKSGEKNMARIELERLLARDEKFPEREAAQALMKQL